MNFKTANPKYTWYASPDMNWVKALSLTAGVFLTFLALFYLGGADFIYNQVVHPLEFRIRNSAGLNPRLDPSIKIFAVDHKTMNNIGLETIPANEWTLLFRGLSKAQPKAILIDKTFPLPLSHNMDDMQALKDAIQAAAPVTVGAFHVSDRLPGFSEISARALDSNIRSLPWLKITPGFLYGPEENLKNSFSQFGHVNDEDHGYIRPIIRTTDGVGLPFWSFTIAELSAKEGSLIINGQPLPVNDKGLTLINLSSTKDYWSKTYSLISLLQKSRINQPLSEIHPGDIVVILGNMVQGSTSFKSTPSGTMPSGFVMVEAINSVLTGRWLKPIGGEPFFLLLGCLVGMFCALNLRAISFVLTLVLIEAAIIGIGILAFAFKDLLVPWAFPAVGFLFTGIILFAEKTRVAEKKTKELRTSLGGMIGEQKLKTMLASHMAELLQPKNQVLSVMFIDIVGFSVTAEQQRPEEVFNQLRSILDEISEIVHDCGGTVDKSLGDGMLCFFGFEIDSSNANQKHHTEQALDCALKIQQRAAERCLHWDGKSPIFPLRIGINTGEVYIGDLGGKKKIEFTVIGHSVNYAQRLEQACDIFRILVGKATWDLLPNIRATSKAFSKKQIPIKHQEELSYAYELNPFAYEPEILTQALAVYRSATGLMRTEERFVVEAASQIKVSTNLGNGSRLDYSRNGISVHLDNYFGKGTPLNISITSDNPVLNKKLEKEGLNLISGTIRWGRQNENGFRHGILLGGLSDEKKEKLLQLLNEFSTATHCAV